MRNFQVLVFMSDVLSVLIINGTVQLYQHIKYISFLHGNTNMDQGLGKIKALYKRSASSLYK